MSFLASKIDIFSRSLVMSVILPCDFRENLRIVMIELGKTAVTQYYFLMKNFISICNLFYQLKLELLLTWGFLSGISINRSTFFLYVNYNIDHRISILSHSQTTRSGRPVAGSTTTNCGASNGAQKTTMETTTAAATPRASTVSAPLSTLTIRRGLFWRHRGCIIDTFQHWGYILLT